VVLLPADRIACDPQEIPARVRNEIAAGLIPLIGTMLVLLLVHKTRTFERGRDIAGGQSQMIDAVAFSCAQPENRKSCPASSTTSQAVL
jgi:hypothetical protein